MSCRCEHVHSCVNVWNKPSLCISPPSPSVSVSQATQRYPSLAIIEKISDYGILHHVQEAIISLN